MFYKQVFSAISNYGSKQFPSIWKYFLPLRSLIFIWVFTFSSVLSKYFPPFTRPSKDPITMVKICISFCFLSLAIVHRNIIKYKLCVINYAGNTWVWSLNFLNVTEILSHQKVRSFYSYPRKCLLGAMLLWGMT